MFGERSNKDHDNYVERMLNSEDTRIKQNTFNYEVTDSLDKEINLFYAFQRQKKMEMAKK